MIHQRPDCIQTLNKIFAEKGCYKNQCAFCPIDPIDCGLNSGHKHITEKQHHEMAYKRAVELKKYYNV